MNKRKDESQVPLCLHDESHHRQPKSRRWHFPGQQGEAFRSKCFCVGDPTWHVYKSTLSSFQGLSMDQSEYGKYVGDKILERL